MTILRRFMLSLTKFAADKRADALQAEVATLLGRIGELERQLQEAKERQAMAEGLAEYAAQIGATQRAWLSHIAFKIGSEQAEKQEERPLWASRI